MQELQPPSRLASGRFVLLKPLGEGGMAWVYSAWDERLRVPRAIKILKPEYAARRKLRARFEGEAHAMARLEHPNVVRVYDVGDENGLAWMAMELADGGSISDWVDSHGPMPPELAARVLAEMCKGIGAAHELGIIHRDIKPQNVLVDRRGTCKVTDFGIARLETQSQTRTGAVMGTLGYMAPEQRVNAKDVDRRADVYALGATLYVLLSGRQPGDLFMARNEPEMLVGIHPELADVIITACGYKRDDRYEDCDDLSMALMNTQAFRRTVGEEVPSLVLFNEGVAKLRTPSNPTLAELSQQTPAPPPSPTITPMSMAEPALSTPDEPVSPTILPVSMTASSPTTPEELVPIFEEPVSHHTPRPVETDSLPPRPTVPSMSTSPLVSYDMPGYDEGPAETTPSWVVREERPPERQDFRVTTEAERHKHARAPDAPAQDRELFTEAEREKLFTASQGLGDALSLVMQILKSAVKMLWKPMSAFSIPLGGIAVLVGSQVMAGAANVKAAEAVAYDKRTALYSTIDSETKVLEDLEDAGIDVEALTSLYAVYSDASGDERLVSAMRYASQVDVSVTAATETAAPEMAHKVTMARRRVDRINNARRAYTASMVDWEEAADTTRGRWAVDFGMAVAP